MMGLIRPDSEDRRSTADRGVRLAITEIVTETLGNVAEVHLSPQELTVTQRQLLRRPAKKATVGVHMLGLLHI